VHFPDLHRNYDEVHSVSLASSLYESISTISCLRRESPVFTQALPFTLPLLDSLEHMANQHGITRY
jgi:hypothetical protein